MKQIRERSKGEKDKETPYFDDKSLLESLKGAITLTKILDDFSFHD
jgi:hypothetical protein